MTGLSGTRFAQFFEERPPAEVVQSGKAVAGELDSGLDTLRRTAVAELGSSAAGPDLGSQCIVVVAELQQNL